MNRRTRAWALLGVASSLLACGNEAVPGAASAGNASVGAAGTGAGTGGAVSSAGNSAAGSGTAGSSATPTSGSGGGSSGGSAGASAGTAGSAGAGGVNGGSGGGGAGGGAGGAANTLPKRVLLYHFSTLVIASVPAQLTLLKSQLMTWGYEVEDSVKPEDISTANLARFGGVGMINTCFEPFGTGKTGESQTAALKAFVEAGGGLFGTHCASVTFQTASPPNPYNALIGGRGGGGSFEQKSACRTLEQHPTTAMLAPTFDYTGNLDNADYVAEDSKVLVKCKWSGGDMKDVAVSWYRTPGMGRVFYTNFAKEDADLKDATLGQKHILLGLGWTLGR